MLRNGWWLLCDLLMHLRQVVFVYLVVVSSDFVFDELEKVAQFRLLVTELTNVSLVELAVKA